ncbi:MAG: hypothetical protein PHQ18_04775 [Patescibacteria group bacterium]|nr:hypothetical protein [Patescibacteria group bacterium]
MKNIVKYSILSVVLVVSFFTAYPKSVEAGVGLYIGCEPEFGKSCIEMLQPNHFAMLDLLFYYTEEGGYYDLSSGQHLHYVPNNTLKQADKISPEVIFGRVDSNCFIYDEKSGNLTCYNNGLERNYFAFSILVNDKDNYLKSYEAYKSLDSNLLYSSIPTRFQVLKSVPYNYEILVHNYYGFPSGTQYNMFLDYEVLGNKGVFLKDTKSVLFDYNLSFASVKDLSKMYIKVNVKDTKGNLSSVLINLGEQFEKRSKELKQYYQSIQ